MGTQFMVLDATDRVQGEKWLEIWENWDLGDIFAHPEYVKLFTRECDKAICLVQKSDAGMILLPLILRPISVEKWADERCDLNDASAPYGYGGPYASGNFDLDLFWRHLTEWAKDNAVITLFFRLSPYATDIKNQVETLEVCGNIIVRTLTEGKSGIWMDYKHTVRTCVKSAECNGLTVEFDVQGEHLEDFVRIYYQTMRRLNAEKLYFFSPEFFQKIVNKLAGHFGFCHVRYQGKIIASKLVLVSKYHLYPFLGGSEEACFHLNPNPLLDTSIFNWGIDNKKTTCVLGGGYAGQTDGVFQYKKKFAPAGMVPYLIGKHIFDAEAYNCMLERRKRYEIENGGSWDENESYFPAYRANRDFFKREGGALSDRK